MLKSTHKPSGSATASTPLPDGWIEHKAPTGHTYYYNASTKKSTYTRPAEPPVTVGPALTNSSGLLEASHSFLQYQSVRPAGPNAPSSYNDFGASRNYKGAEDSVPFSRAGPKDYERPRDRRPQPTDKPISKHPIPGCEPWLLINTKLGRRFVYNSEKGQSYWRIPEKLKEGILVFDQQRIKEKAEAFVVDKTGEELENAPGAANMPRLSAPSGEPVREALDKGHESSEYEEVEVSDEEKGENSPKRQRTEDPPDDEPVEFNEDDIAFQLAAMGQEYGLEPDEYGDDQMEDWVEEDNPGLTHEDSVALFKDLLNDTGVSPYSPWDKIIEDGKLVDDTRYTALTTTKARKEVWEAWSRDKIKLLREQRAREEKKDPRIPYLAFLQKQATPKLYWPEFKRKYKKETEMRDASLADKDREKWYREHINRLKLPSSTLKSDLLNLLKSQPLSVLNNATLPSHLPPAILADVKYISIEALARDALVESFIETLPPPPLKTSDEQDEEAVKEKAEREHRQRALQERERHVAEEKRRQRRNLELGKGRLREEEADIARAMNFTKKGLKDHLVEMEMD